MSPCRLGFVALAACVVALVAPGSALAITPSIDEHPLHSAVQPYGVEAGPDGALWFAESAGSQVGRMTTAGVVTEYPLPSASATQYDLTAGPDANMWLAEEAANRIAKITPTGAITEFRVPTPSSSPTGIITGPDQNLWFTESAAGKIARITPAGTITEFPLPSTSSQPSAIAAGPDQNLWTVESAANKVARITTTGVVTEFSIPTSSAGLYDIATGPDGNLWFAERNAGKIGRITTTGSITEFPLPSPTSQPLAIAAGPDDALWFTEVAANAIGRITTAGAVSQHPLPTPNASAASIGRGPDGNMWFTERAANNVGRITTPPTVSAGTPSELKDTTVTIAVDVNAHAQATAVRVESGPTSAYDRSTPAQQALAGTNEQTLSATVGSLTPATTYHYRTVASNGTGTTYGTDHTFTTAAGAPTTSGDTALPQSALGDMSAPSSTPFDTAVAPSTDNVETRAARVGAVTATTAHAAPQPAVISSAPVVVLPNGVAPIGISCPATATQGCRGKMVLRLANNSRSNKAKAKAKKRASAARCARGCRPLGHAAFEAKRGKTTSVHVHLSADARTILARNGKLEAKVTVTVATHGRIATSSRLVTLRARA